MTTSRERAAAPRRGRVALVFKLALAGAMLAALLRSDRLALDKLRIFADRPEVLLASLGTWLGVGITAAAVRWWLLLRGVGVKASLGRLVATQMVASFVGLSPFGNVGADVARIYFAAGRQALERGPQVLLSVVVDRLCGLGGLFLAGAFGISLALPTLWQQAGLRPLLIYAYAGSALVLGTLVAFFLLPVALWELPARWLEGRARGSRVVRQVAELWRSVGVFRQQPLTLVSAVALSVPMHLGLMALQRLVASVVLNKAVPLAPVATAAPLATLVTSLPLAPGGFGIGHVAFDRFFALVGLGSGADIFNIVTVGQMALGLLGAIPFLLLRGQLRAVQVVAPPVSVTEDAATLDDKVSAHG